VVLSKGAISEFKEAAETSSTLFNKDFSLDLVVVEPATVCNLKSCFGIILNY